MNDKTLQLLTELANKLGTTADHLWGILLKQVPITAWTEAIVATLVLAAWVRGYIFIKLKTKKGPSPHSPEYPPRAAWEGDDADMAWYAFGIVGIAVFVVVIFATTTIATAVFNPEYLALKQILPS